MAQQLRVSTACPGNLSLVSSTQVQWLTATNHNSIPRRVINCFWPPKHYTHAKVCVRVHEYVCAHAHTQTHIKSLSHIWNIIILAGSPSLRSHQNTASSLQQSPHRVSYLKLQFHG